MATVTFQMADKDVARLLRYLFDSGAEPGVRIAIHFTRRPRQGDGPMNLAWEVEMLPNNSGIYKILLKGGQDEEGIHDDQGQG